MKIELVRLTQEAIEQREYREALIININGLSKLEFIDGEPEDATISRDFSDINNIIEVVKMAYNAGKNGEELEINYKEVEDI